MLLPEISDVKSRAWPAWAGLSPTESRLGLEPFSRAGPSWLEPKLELGRTATYCQIRQSRVHQCLHKQQFGVLFWVVLRSGRGRSAWTLSPSPRAGLSWPGGRAPAQAQVKSRPEPEPA